MNSDGTNARSIGVEGYHVHFSPDGMRLVYSSGVPGSQEFFTCALDGTGVQQLTKNNFDDGSPNWSPDGRKIVFDSNRDGNTDIYVMNSDGTQVRRLTNSFPAMSAVPEWSPDGTQIVMSRNVSGSPNGQIFVMDADGSNARQVTQVASPGWAQEPTWKPKSTTSIQNGSETALPQDVKLYQNYPNPFNPTTDIRYRLSRAVRVKLEIYGTLGDRVRLLVDEVQTPGSNISNWDGADDSGNRVWG